MEGARRLTARQNAARPDSRDSHKQYKNRRPEFESIMLGKPKDGLDKAALQKLQTNISRARKAAASSPEASQLMDAILMDLATSIDNNIVILATERLAELAESVKPEHLADVLSETRKEMLANHGHADSIPRAMLNNYQMTDGKVKASSLARMTSRGFSKSKTKCPEDASNETKKDYEAGEMNDIQGVAEVRSEQIQNGDLQPAAIDFAPEIQLQEIQPQADPQPATYNIPEPAQKTEELMTEPLMVAQSALSPLQIWDEDRKLQSGSRDHYHSDDPTNSSSSQVRDENRKEGPRDAKPAPEPRLRPVANTGTICAQSRPQRISPENILMMRVLCSPKQAPWSKTTKPSPKRPDSPKAKPAPKEKTAKIPDLKAKPDPKQSEERDVPEPTTKRKPKRHAKSLTKPKKKTKPSSKAKKKTAPKKKASPKKMKKAALPEKKKEPKKKAAPKKRPPRKKKLSAKVKAARRQPKKGRKKALAKPKRKKKSRIGKKRKRPRPLKAVKTRKRKNSSKAPARKPKPKLSVKARKARVEKASKMKIRAFRTKNKKRRRRKAA